MICPECKIENPEGAKFCRKCGYPLEENKAQIEEQEKTDKKVKYIFLVILAAITICIGVFISLQPNENEETAENETVVEEVSENEEETEETESTSEENVDLPEIDSIEETDYDNVLSLDDYETFYAENYSFGFPLYLYDRVEEYGKEYGHDGYTFSSESDEYSWLDFISVKREDSESLEDITKERCVEIKGEMTGIENILYKPKEGVCVFAGTNYDDENQKLYDVIRVDENYIYHMEVGFPDTDDKELNDKMNYYVDCLYRMCSFSGGTYRPRTYDQFLNDDMGTKK